MEIAVHNYTTFFHQSEIKEILFTFFKIMKIKKMFLPSDHELSVPHRRVSFSDYRPVLPVKVASS